MMTQEPNEIVFEQAEEFVITDLETLKVVADPLRLQIIELVFDQPSTVKQVARQLDLPPSKLYYHINLLEKHGLISISSKRIVSGIVEKSYMTSARNIRVMKGLLTPQRADEQPTQGNVSIFVDAILNDAKQDIQRNANQGVIDLTGENASKALRISRSTTRMTEAQALEFQERLRDLVEEFKTYKDDGANLDEQGFALVFAFYPTARANRPPQNDE